LTYDQGVMIWCRRGRKESGIWHDLFKEKKLR